MGPRTKRDGWGSLALPRMSAHLMVVIAAALTTAVTAMLAGALAVLAGQAMSVAVRHDLAAASGTTMLFSGSVSRADGAVFRTQLPREISGALDGTPFTLYHATWSDPLGFTAGSGPAANGNTEITEATAFDRITAHAVLVSGAWPGAPAGGGTAIPAALPATAATAMRVHVGDTIKLRDRDDGATVRFRITGLYRPAQAAGLGTEYWQLDLVSLSGVSTASGFSTFGPLTVQPSAFTAGGLVQDQASWLAEPVTADLPQDNFSDVAANLNALRDNVGNPGGTLPSLALTTRLPTVLDNLAANLDVARSLLAICAILLVLLGGAVLLAVARLLQGQREGESAMMAARGATRGQLLRLTAAEALPLCLVASAAGGVAGIWLARVLARTSALPGGPLSTAPLSGQFRSAGEAAAAVAIGALLVMLIPALSRVTPGTARVRRGRQAAISAASRAGADIGLIALAVLTCWQLRHYSAVSAGASGTFGVDPVVAIAPALALAGGTVAALRLLPLGGKAGDKLAADGRRLTTTLGSWQISRQPIRQGGAALLIVLAVATATLALTQRQSWLQSGHDQAAFTAGADVTVQTVQPLTEAQATTLTRTPGVRHAMPAAVYPYSAGTGTVLAIGAAQAPNVVLIRPDQAKVPASRLFGMIKSPDQAPGVRLPDRGSSIQLTAQLGPASLRLAPAVVAPSVEDAAGVVYQLESVTLPADGQPHTFTIPVTPGAAAITYPLRLTGLDVTYPMPAGKNTTPAAFQLDSVSGAAGSELARFSPAATSGELAGAQNGFGTAGAAAAPSLVSYKPAGPAQRMVFQTGYGLSNSGLGPPGRLDGQLTLTALAPGAVAVIAGIATQAYLSANGTSAGSTVQATIGGAPVGVHIVAAVPSFPTLSAGASALIVDLASAQNFLTGRALDGAPVTQWWLATANHGVPPGLTAGLPSGTAVTSVTAVTDGLLNDPLSSLPQQALLGLAVAALLLASTGFCVSIAAGVRQREAENALLAALGVAPRAAASQLCLEKLMLSLPSAVAGLALGAFLSELLVPAITLSPSATTPQPPVLIEFGWGPTLAAALALAVLPVLAAALVLVRRPDPAASLRAAEAA
jgi:FtsX-like permease family